MFLITMKVNTLVRIFRKYLQLFYDNSQRKDAIVSVGALHPLIKNKNVFVFDFYTICVQVASSNFCANCIEVILTSTQVVSKLDF